MNGLQNLLTTESLVRARRERYEAEAARERLVRAARLVRSGAAPRTQGAVYPWQVGQIGVAPCCEAV